MFVEQKITLQTVTSTCEAAAARSCAFKIEILALEILRRLVSSSFLVTAFARSPDPLREPTPAILLKPAATRAQLASGSLNQRQPRLHRDHVLGRLTQLRPYLAHALQAYLLHTIHGGACTATQSKRKHTSAALPHI